jgi:hypothetical protein
VSPSDQDPTTQGETARQRSLADLSLAGSRLPFELSHTGPAGATHTRPQLWPVRLSAAGIGQVAYTEVLCANSQYRIILYKLAFLAGRCSSQNSQPTTHNTMSWTLEAELALAALLLTFIMSGVGLVLKHRRRAPHLRNSIAGLLREPVRGITELVFLDLSLTQLDPESDTQHCSPSELRWVGIADVRQYQQATYNSMVRFQQKRSIPIRTITH